LGLEERTALSRPLAGFKGPILIRVIGRDEEGDGTGRERE